MMADIPLHTVADILLLWLADEPVMDASRRDRTKARQIWDREHQAWLERGPRMARLAIRNGAPEAAPTRQQETAG
jgi:hypothetical protein